MAAMTSSTWNAIDSSPALARCARRLPELSPVMVARAWSSHHGAPRPVKAGTSTTPSLLAAAAAATRLGVLPNSWASQVNVAPLERMLPSSA